MVHSTYRPPRGARATERVMSLFRLALLALVVVVPASGCATADALPWSDDFSDPNSGWRAESDASAEIRYADGRLMIRVLWPDRLSWASGGRVLSDFALSVEATQWGGPDDNEYGVLARMQDGQRFYMFSISGDGYFRIVRRDGARETVLSDDWTFSEAIHRGAATNNLEVTCLGSRLTMAVNGTVLAEVTDSAYSSGDVALYAGSFRDPGEGVEIRFDQFAVTRLADK